MSKKNFVEKLNGNLTIVDVENGGDMYDVFIKTITDLLEEGEEVTLNGIGKLKVVQRKARNGINPKTKEKLVISAKKAVTFKASKKIKDLIN